MTEKTNHRPPSEEAPPAAPTPPAPAKGPGFLGAIWKFFSSVHLAVILLLLLAGISIIGTVLAQGDSQADNVRLFENFVTSLFDTLGVVDVGDPASVAAQSNRIRLAADRLYRFSVRAGFTNLYHAWYFYLLLGLFSFNLLVCSLKRWPHTWKMMARNPVRMEERRFRSMPTRRAIGLDMSVGEAKEKVAAALKQSRYSRRVEEDQETVYIFGQKGVLSRLGVYSTHLSIIIILIGGIIGVTSGFKGYMQIDEGTSTRRFYDRRAKTTKLLPFEVRCDNFQVDYYPGSRRPKDYYSDLTVVIEGEEKMSKRIEVNTPLVWDDIWFYQSSYGETGRGMKVTLRIADPESGEERIEGFDTRRRNLPDLGLSIQVLQVLPDFALDENQKPFSKSSQPTNPAALVEIKRPDGATQRTWLFQRYPDVSMAEDLPVDLTFVDYGGIQYTGLQVVYDPGVWVIWTGCTVMVIGLYLAFFISHRRVWLRIEGTGGKTEVKLAGSSNKNKEGFSDEFGRLGDLIGGVGKRADT